MKNDLLNSIKESLDNFEPAYNPKAWDAMSSKLDAVKPTTTPKSNLKWYITAAAATVATLGTLYFVNSNKEIITETPQVEVSENRTDDNVINPITNESSEQSTIQSSNDLNTVNNSDRETLTVVNDNNSVNGQTNTNSTVVSSNTSNNSNNRVNANEDGNEAVVNNTIVTNNNNPITFVAPTVADMCQFSKTTIYNSNDVPMVVQYPNGKVWTVKGNSQASLVASADGIYMVGYMEGSNFRPEGSFNVHPAPNANFIRVDVDLKYDEFGLPAATFQAVDGASNYEWSFDNQTESGTKAVGHFYISGNHNVQLKVTSENGCTSEKNTTIYIEDNYNLKAVTSFVPTDLDPRNNVFMPASLKERGDAFQLLIIDPNDGHVMYATTDANAGWDGIDKETGVMVPYQKAYIWKVTIVNPRPGEQGVYAGTVIPLESRR